MAAVDNSSPHSLSPKVLKVILIAREPLVFQLLLSISAPSRSVTDYLEHRIWISSLTTAPSWQSRLQPSRGIPSWVMFWWRILGFKRCCWGQILSVPLLSEDFTSCNKSRSPCSQKVSPGFRKVLSQEKDTLSQYHDRWYWLLRNIH